jgi:predicted nuclease with RNAse H fold
VSVSEVRVGVEDDVVLQHARTADKVGIDCPLGWPDAFVAFIRDHHDHKPVPPYEGTAGQWRRSLANRLTDIRVRDRLGMTPLSVSTDRIGLTAMRAARLQTRLLEAGLAIDRTGDGLVVEVYPAAGLNYWNLNHRQYKGTKNAPALGSLVTALVDRASWLHLGEHEEACRRSDHAFDAVIAALLARAAAVGKTLVPSDAEREIAAREGWIALPTCTLDELPA